MSDNASVQYNNNIPYVTVIGILAEAGVCPTESHLALPNVIRGLVFYETSEEESLVHCFLGHREMELALKNYFLLPDGRDIAVYTSKKDPNAKADPHNIPEHVYTARIFTPPSQKNPLLDLPFYCLECAGSLGLCQKVS